MLHVVGAAIVRGHVQSLQLSHIASRALVLTILDAGLGAEARSVEVSRLTRADRLQLLRSISIDGHHLVHLSAVKVDGLASSLTNLEAGLHELDTGALLALLDDARVDQALVLVTEVVALEAQ